MSQENRQTDVKTKTQQLLQGSLKHVRAAALAAALAPLAAVAANAAIDQQNGSGGTAVVPSPCDFVTSGGFVFLDSGHKASFGAHGGCKRGGFWGHVNYVDHSTGYHLNSTQITGYVTPAQGSTVREICGMAKTNGDEPQPVFFRMRLVDNGEPGTLDQFAIATSNGYSVGTRLLGNDDGPDGGNVQLHDPNPSTAGPETPPTEFAMCNGVFVQ